jgi:hypothetical protein
VQLLLTIMRGPHAGHGEGVGGVLSATHMCVVCVLPGQVYLIPFPIEIWWCKVILIDL